MIHSQRIILIVTKTNVLKTTKKKTNSKPKYSDGGDKLSKDKKHNKCDRYSKDNNKPKTGAPPHTNKPKTPPILKLKDRPEENMINRMITAAGNVGNSLEHLFKFFDSKNENLFNTALENYQNGLDKLDCSNGDIFECYKTFCNIENDIKHKVKICGGILPRKVTKNEETTDPADEHSQGWEKVKKKNAMK